MTAIVGFGMAVDAFGRAFGPYIAAAFLGAVAGYFIGTYRAHKEMRPHLIPRAAIDRLRRSVEALRRERNERP